VGKKNACFECGKDLSGSLPFICKWCGKSFCIEHQLPENHYCTEFYAGKKPKIKKGRRKWYKFWKR